MINPWPLHLHAVSSVGQFLTTAVGSRGCSAMTWGATDGKDAVLEQGTVVQHTGQSA